MRTRREFLKAGGIILAGLSIANKTAAGGHHAQRAAGVIEVRMMSDLMGSNVWFDPIGFYIEPGQTVRWTCAENVHTVSAYHPRNGGHCLRIPEDAASWDSGFLSPGQHFELKLTIEGVYDYYCMPHEEAGMVGRIIVGKPAGPGSLPFDYFEGKPGTEDWRPVPLTAQKAFPSVEQIMSEKIVRLKSPV